MLPLYFLSTNITKQIYVKSSNCRHLKHTYIPCLVVNTIHSMFGCKHAEWYNLFDSREIHEFMWSIVYTLLCIYVIISYTAESSIKCKRSEYLCSENNKCISLSKLCGGYVSCGIQGHAPPPCKDYMGKLHHSRYA